VKDYPPFTITNKVGDNHNNVPTRLGEYTFNKIWNGAAAFTNGNYIIFYGGTGYGWQWATDESQLAANGPALSEVANVQAYVKSWQFQLLTHWYVDWSKGASPCGDQRLVLYDCKSLFFAFFFTALTTLLVNNFSHRKCGTRIRDFN